MVSGFILFGLLSCLPCRVAGVGVDRNLWRRFSPIPWMDINAVLHTLICRLVSANQSINQSIKQAINQSINQLIHNWEKKVSHK